MKSIQKISLCMPFMLLMVSCISTNHLAHDFANEQKKGRDTTNRLFLVTKEGEKLAVQKLSIQHKLTLFPNGQSSKESVVADGKKLGFGEYQAIQTASAFKLLYQPEKDSNAGNGVYVARLRAGKMKLYGYEYRSATKYKYQTKKLRHGYVFQKEDNQPVKLDYTHFADAIKDNSLATQTFKQLFPSGCIPVGDAAQTLANLTAVVDLYNQTSTGAITASHQ